MAERKKHYIVPEVMELLGITADQVYNMRKAGLIKGHKTRSGKWLFPKGQQVFLDIIAETGDIDLSELAKAEEVEETSLVAAKDRDKDPHEFIQYIKDTEHYTEVFSRIAGVRKSLKITTCNLNNFMVCMKDAEGKDISMHFADFLLELCNRGVKVKIACMKPLWFYAYIHEQLPELENHPKFELRQDKNIHMKVFIFDNMVAYIGSANLTSAAVGRRAKSKRNYEAGLLVKNNAIFKDAYQHFTEVWDDPDVLQYTEEKYNEDLKNLKDRQKNK